MTSITTNIILKLSTNPPQPITKIEQGTVMFYLNTLYFATLNAPVSLKTVSGNSVGTFNLTFYVNPLDPPSKGGLTPTGIVDAIKTTTKFVFETWPTNSFKTNLNFGFYPMSGYNCQDNDCKGPQLLDAVFTTDDCDNTCVKYKCDKTNNICKPDTDGEYNTIKDCMTACTVKEPCINGSTWSHTGYNTPTACQPCTKCSHTLQKCTTRQDTQCSCIGTNCKECTQDKNCTWQKVNNLWTCQPGTQKESCTGFNYSCKGKECKSTLAGGGQYNTDDCDTMCGEKFSCTDIGCTTAYGTSGIKYDTITECQKACKYACKSSECVYDTTGPYGNKIECEAKCLPPKPPKPKPKTTKTKTTKITITNTFYNWNHRYCFGMYYRHNFNCNFNS